jgi:hypothetical protein
MRHLLFALALLILSSGLAQALPPQWQIKYCHSYADDAVAQNKLRLQKRCKTSGNDQASWTNNWYGHYNWCINLSPGNIGAARGEAARRHNIVDHCPFGTF